MVIGLPWIGIGDCMRLGFCLGCRCMADSLSLSKTVPQAKRKGAESDDEGDEDARDSDLDDGLYRGAEGEPDPFFQEDDDPFSDPFFQQGGDDEKTKDADTKATSSKVWAATSLGREGGVF